jgi:hypothetical protein
MKNKFEMIKKAAYIDELQKIAGVGGKVLSHLGKYPTLTGLGIGSTLGSGINVGELYYRKSHPKNKKDKVITNKKILGAAIGGAISGGITGAYLGNTVGLFRTGGRFNRTGYNFKFDPNDFNFKYKYHYNPGASSANTTPLNAVGKQFEDKLHSVKKKVDATKVFRSHVMQHHPDKGGKVEDMASINNVWDSFKKYKFDKLAFLKSIHDNSYNNELIKISNKKNKYDNARENINAISKAVKEGIKNYKKNPLISKNEKLLKRMSKIVKK